MYRSRMMASPSPVDALAASAAGLPHYASTMGLPGAPPLPPPGSGLLAVHAAASTAAAAASAAGAHAASHTPNKARGPCRPGKGHTLVARGRQAWADGPPTAAAPAPSATQRQPLPSFRRLPCHDPQACTAWRPRAPRARCRARPPSRCPMTCAPRTPCGPARCLRLGAAPHATASRARSCVARDGSPASIRETRVVRRCRLTPRPVCSCAAAAAPSCRPRWRSSSSQRPTCRQATR
jgi:hypothetical protein